MFQIAIGVALGILMAYLALCGWLRFTGWRETRALYAKQTAKVSAKWNWSSVARFVLLLMSPGGILLAVLSCFAGPQRSDNV